jgi:hypothetical protein
MKPLNSSLETTQTGLIETSGICSYFFFQKPQLHAIKMLTTNNQSEHYTHNVGILGSGYPTMPSQIPPDDRINLNMLARGSLME